MSEQIIMKGIHGSHQITGALPLLSRRSFAISRAGNVPSYIVFINHRMNMLDILIGKDTVISI